MVASYNNLYKYPKNVKILLDNILGSGKTVLEVAKELHTQGYTQLYLLTGDPDVEYSSTLPSYLKIIIKTGMDEDKLLRQIFKKEDL